MNAAHTPVASPVEELRAIVGPEYVRSAGPADAIDGMQPQFVVEPGSEQEVARALKCADAAGLAVLPRGGATKLGWGNRPKRADITRGPQQAGLSPDGVLITRGPQQAGFSPDGVLVVLSLARLNRVVEHAAADLTVTVEAGCTIADLQTVLAKANQRLALDPLWPEHASVGGVLATNDSGSLRIRYGALRDLIIGINLALPDGTIARSGGKVVKNVAGYDLPKLATGSLGTLAVITQAVFRLHPLSRETRSLTISAENVAEANKAVLAVLDSKLAYTGLQIRTAGDQTPQVDVRFEGTGAGVDAQTAELARLLGSDRVSETAAEVWAARQRLFVAADSALIAKFSALPAGIARFCERAAAQVERAGGEWQMVVQGNGLGNLGVNAPRADLEKLVAQLRSELESDGSFVVLRCPPELKSKIDVWGAPGDALGLMRRIKTEFDRKSTLNPGRFIGGI